MLSKTAARRRSDATAKETQLVRLARERDEALAREQASAEVLRVISASPGDPKPVFEAILQNANRICEAEFGFLWLAEDGGFRAVALHGAPPALIAIREREPILRPSPKSPLPRVAATKRLLHIADLTENEGFRAGDRAIVDLVELAGTRTLLLVPMLKDDEFVGAISIYRKEVRPFGDKQIALLTNFAAQAVIAIENTRLLNELRESLQQRTATSDVLRTISSTPGELEPVFDTILENATRICEARFGNLLLFDGKNMRVVAMHNAPREHAELRRRDPIIPLERSIVRPLVRTKEVALVADITAEEPYASSPLAKAGGARTAMAVPMLREGQLIGAITIYRQEVRPFAGKQIDLVKNFAAQAVIAIENARLLNELRQRTDDLAESLEQQTATSEVLQVISSSTGDLKPVFDAMLANAVKICGAGFGNLSLYDGKDLRMAAMYNPPPAYMEARGRDPIVPLVNTIVGRVVTSKRVNHVHDLAAEEPYAHSMLAQKGGARTALGVPMLREGTLVGTIAIYRQEVRPFTDKQIELVQNFAAQAVIAIENTRLLNELRESLEQQTATSEVLSVISSSPGQLQPVFQAMLANAVRICEAKFGSLFRFDGDEIQFAAEVGTPAEYAEFQKSRRSVRPRPGTLLDRAARTKQVIHTADYAAEPFPGNAATLGGARSTLCVPMLKDDTLVGVIFIYRQEVRPFTDKQIELVQNFAAQAVIAIENTRLLNELRESLQQQTATSEVLSVISSSPGRLEPVFQSVLDNAVRICEAKFGFMNRYEGDIWKIIAVHGAVPAYTESLQQHGYKRPGAETVVARIATTRQLVHIDDLAASRGYIERDPVVVAAVELGGVRTMLGVPMLKEGKLIGAILLYRQEVRPFTDKQIALVQNFAAQAVIAVENARLLTELRQRTDDLTESLEQQTATSEVLRVISASPGELEPVFKAMLENAARICDAKFGVLLLAEGDAYRVAAIDGEPPAAYVEERRRNPIIRPRPETALGRAVSTRSAVQVADIQVEADGGAASGSTGAQLARLAGARTVVAVPMVREDELVGAILIFRQEVRPFTDKQIELVQNFAAQAVIAIENARLLNELRQRTDDLSKSLDDLRTAQDRLVQTQKLASLGQLTAGIAHEIKNPLNFVNNFSGVSVELIDELQEALRDAPLTEKARADINELSDTLRDNLGKIVQHGKRADSIVKNMLLHSREGAGERRPVDINALVEESLNLAYHGARAEKQGFNVALERSFDPAAGEVEAFPQEISRVLLNLIANGFYAAAKRQAQEGANGFEPTIKAATKSLGDRVEIRIRDNGIGIPPEVRDKMFNPFFTTKPAGEGTGLGLSISHDIIVKQHSGSIEVDTEPGKFTEFTIVLPRAAK